MAHRGPTPRHIGNPRLRAARLARRWTEEDVAAALIQLSAELREPEPGATANHVSKWERGARTPSPYYRPRLCVVFDATPQELGFDSTPTLNRAIGDLARRRLQHRPPPNGSEGKASRLSVTAFPFVDRERVATAMTYLWPVDRALLDGLERAGKELVRRADIEAPDTIVPDLRTYRDALAVLLSRSQSEDATISIQILASETSRNIGWLSDHVHQWSDTYANFALAESLAREASSGRQLATVLINKSNLYAERAAMPADFTQAILLADAASVAVGPDAPAGLRAWILAERATYAAATGDGITASRNLDHAYRLAAAAPSEMNLFSDYDSAWLDGYQGTVALRLQPDQAIAIYEEVLRKTDPRLTWERTSALGHLAEAYAAKCEQDIDHVCALLVDVVALAQATGDRRGLELARRARQRHLARAAASQEVSRLDELLRSAISR
jgi:transcriptional regulator with XRE-family HTH domain